MFTEAQSPVPWDLADKKTQKTRFTADSFYLVVDGFKSESVHHACTILKTYLRSFEGVRVRGPKAMPTERRRYLAMPEVQTSDGHKGVKLRKALRYRCVLLVINPSYGCIGGLTNVSLPSEVTVKVKPYENQFDLRDDR